MEHVIRNGIDKTFEGDDLQHTALNGNYRYRALLGPQHVDPNLDGVRGRNDFTDRLRKTWAALSHDRNVLPCGEIELSNVLLLGVSGLCIDMGTGSALVGAPLNWGVDHAHWYMSVLSQQYPGVGIIDPDHFTIEVDEDADRSEERFILMSSPGWNIYGHWIVDYIPRLHLLNQMEGQRDLQLLFPELPAWTELFLDAFSVEPSRIRRIDTDERRIFAKLRLPSATKNGFSVAQPVARTAWTFFSNYVRDRAAGSVDPNKLPLGEKIFLSRRSFGSARRIDNILQLEALAAASGFRIVEPEKFSILEQATIMRHARIVVGEDGSALHNIIFADPGAHLGVIGTPDRPNLWHVSLCQSLAHRISYIEAAATEGDGRMVDVEEYKNFVQNLTPSD